MNDSDVKKEIGIVDNSFQRSPLHQLVKHTAKNGNFSLGITMFSAPPADRWKNKKQDKALKETRKELDNFFKKNQKSLPLFPRLHIAGIPESLARVLLLTAAPRGMGWKIPAGGELFSLVCIDKPDHPATKETLALAARIMNLAGPQDMLHQCSALVNFQKHKLKQILPLHTVEPAETSAGPGNIIALETLKDLQGVFKNFDKLDKKNRNMVETGLRCLELIQEEKEIALKVPLLAAAVEFFTQASEKEPKWYFDIICRDLAEKIDFKPKQGTLFKDFFQWKLSLAYNPENFSQAATKPGKKELPPAMEHFYRLLLKKTVTDAAFLKQTLPQAKTRVKKELKKQELKRGWRKFPGKYIARLIKEP